MKLKSSFSCLVLLPLASCALTGPVIDPTLRRSDTRACYTFEEAPVLPQCLRVMRRNPQGGFVEATNPVLAAGEDIIATLVPGEECAANYDHALLVADTDGSGRGLLSVPDAVGRQSAAREIAWSRARNGRRWAIGGIDTPIQIPGALHVAVHEGNLRLRQICLAHHDGLNLGL